MNKCLRILITAKFSDNQLRGFIQRSAKDLGLEGTAQVINKPDKKVQIAICGYPEKLDRFIDFLHTGNKDFDLKTIEVEPFLKDKDYRSVFRVIE